MSIDMRRAGLGVLTGAASLATRTSASPLPDCCEERRGVGGVNGISATLATPVTVTVKVW